LGDGYTARHARSPAGIGGPGLPTLDHDDHVRLIRDGVTGDGTTWADLGCGEGAFTLALADLLGPAGQIHSVDCDECALLAQARVLRDRFPGVAVIPLVADFNRPLELPPLDGIVMANSLHFERDRLAVVPGVCETRVGNSP